MAEGAIISQRLKSGFGIAPAPRLALIRRAIVIAGALALAACGAVVPRTGQPTGPRVAPPPSAPVVEPGLPNDTSRHRIALLVPLTGANAGVGRSLANATQLALLDANNDQLRITTYDTATGSAEAARRAIAEGAQLILGPLLADDVRAVMPMAKRSNVPVISFSNDASMAGSGAYLMGYSPSQSIERVVDYARGQGVKAFGGLIANGVYGQRASTAFLRAVEAQGGQVLSMQTYDHSNASIVGATARLGKAAPFGAVLIVDDGTTSAGVVPLMRRNGATTARVLGTERWNAEASIAAKPALNGAWFASVADNLYRQYATKYRARFGAAPYRLSSMGYDAVLLTIRIAREWPMNAPFPEDKLRDKVGFTGLDGAFRFGRDGVAERALEVQEVRDGTTVTVSPAPTGF